MGNYFGTTWGFYLKLDIRAIKIPLPPISEQKKIAEILLIADEEIEKEITLKEYLEIIKKGLMQGLLTGKVRVKVCLRQMEGDVGFL